MRAFLVLLRRDLDLAMREGSAVGAALGFYLMVVAIMPLGLGPDLALLSRIAAGVLWIALLLAALLSLGRIFEIDDEDGSLEVLATGPLPLELVAAAKSLVHWLTTALPLSLLAPILGLLLNLEIAASPALLGSLIVGTPAISFIGTLCAALTLRSRRSGLLLAVLGVGGNGEHCSEQSACQETLITGHDNPLSPVSYLIRRVGADSLCAQACGTGTLG